MTTTQCSSLFQEYFASITNTDSQLDQGLADEIMTFLDKKGKRFSNGDPNKLTIQVIIKQVYTSELINRNVAYSKLFKET